MIRTCLECGGDMTVERSRPDPHEPPVVFLAVSYTHLTLPTIYSV